MLTLILDDMTTTITSGAGGLSLHHTEDALCGMSNDARTMTGRTNLINASGFCTRTVTFRTYDVLAHLELLGNTFGDFL